MKYDYLIVGAGLFGCVFAHEMKKGEILGEAALVGAQRPELMEGI